MVTDYNQGSIAEQYQQATTEPWRERLETYSFLKHIGNVTGKNVLDVACGEGHYTRLLGKAGAARVVGIDISDRMIALARAHETRQPLGIHYRVEDARTVAGEPKFDLVVAAWLLVYAQTRDELAQMCRGLASRLGTGGRFVTVIRNPALYTLESLPDYRKYGFTLTLPEQLVDGAPYTITLLLEDSKLEIENYYLPSEAYDSALTEAGFRDITVHLPELSPAAHDEPGYWDDLLTHPPFIVLDAVKAG